MLGRNVVSLKAQLLVRRQEASPARGSHVRLVKRLEKRLLKPRPTPTVPFKLVQRSRLTMMALLPRRTSSTLP